MNKFFKKIKLAASYSLITSIILSSFLYVLPKKVEAQWAVFDVPNTVVGTLTSINTTSLTVKEYVLDTVAYTIINAIIERIAASTVNWINNGFQGNPAFLTNPEQYFGNIADQIAGDYISKNPAFSFMCAPFKDRVRIALTKVYKTPYSSQCTLTKVASNWDSYMSDFYEGGWDSFIEISQNSQNNPLGLFSAEQSLIQLQISSSVDQRQKELTQNNGFLNFKKCTQYSNPTTAGDTYITSEPVIDDEGNITGYEDVENTATGNEEPTCLSEETETPGKVIETQLNSVLGLGNDKLKAADEINEIIGALLNQLVNQAMRGLRSLANKVGGGGSSYTDNLLNHADTTGGDPNNQIPGDQSFVCTTSTGEPGTKTGINGICTPVSVDTPDTQFCVKSDGTAGMIVNGVCGDATNQPPAGGGGGGNSNNITFQDGSSFSGLPSDSDCALANRSALIDRVNQIFSDFRNLFDTNNTTMADIYYGLECEPGGVIPI